MRDIAIQELEEILENHKKWFDDEEDGERAVLRHTVLNNVNLQDADLHDADLYDADLSYADLQDADLQGADLQDADLSYANLQDTNLICANLQYADLSHADLQGADLSSADLCHADLSGADLRDAILTGVDLANVERPWLVCIGLIGSRSSKTIYFADYDTVLCGCWNDYKGGTLSKFKKRINEVYPADDKEHQRYRIEYLSAIKMFETMREAYIKSAKEEKNNENNIK